LLNLPILSKSPTMWVEPLTRRLLWRKSHFLLSASRRSKGSGFNSGFHSTFFGQFRRFAASAVPSSPHDDKKKQNPEQQSPVKSGKGNPLTGVIDDTMLPSNKQVLSKLMHHIWPRDDAALRTRTVVALSLLASSKLITVQVPFLFKDVVDSLSIAPEQASAMALPLAALVGWGVARTSASAFNELRSAVFAKVAQSGIRNVAGSTFRHLHDLDLSFHLGRNIGALSRAIDRGTRGIHFILNSMTFNVFPTFLELGLVTGLLAYKCGWEYSAITTMTISAYTA